MLEVLHVPGHQSLGAIAVGLTRQHRVPERHPSRNIPRKVVDPRSDPPGRGLRPSPERVQNANRIDGREIVQPQIRFGLVQAERGRPAELEQRGQRDRRVDVVQAVEKLSVRRIDRITTEEAIDQEEIANSDREAPWRPSGRSSRSRPDDAIRSVGGARDGGLRSGSEGARRECPRRAGPSPTRARSVRSAGHDASR